MASFLIASLVMTLFTMLHTHATAVDQFNPRQPRSEMIQMKTSRKKASEHREIIRKLFDADRNAGERLENARQEAAKIVKTAGREADEIIEKARSDAKAESEAIVRETENEAESSASKTDASKQIQALRRHARDNTDRAVDFLIDWVVMKNES